jgi:hypothetical protein
MDQVAGALAHHRTGSSTGTSSLQHPARPETERHASDFGMARFPTARPTTGSPIGTRRGARTGRGGPVDATSGWAGALFLATGSHPLTATPMEYLLSTSTSRFRPPGPAIGVCRAGERVIRDRQEPGRSVQLGVEMTMRQSAIARAIRSVTRHRPSSCRLRAPVRATASQTTLAVADRAAAGWLLLILAVPVLASGLGTCCSGPPARPRGA